VRGGHYTRTEDVRQEHGRNNSQWLALIEAALPEFSNAVAATKVTTPREILQALRASWRQIREREAKARHTEAVTLPSLVED
jgi:hypothetical protein